MIEIKSVTIKAENEKILLKNINTSFELGKYHTMIGANGSGKTTFAKVVAGLENVEIGEILLNGKPISAYDVAYVFQNPTLQFVYDKVKNDLAFGLENLNYTRETIEKEIDLTAQRLEIEKLLNRSVTDLSGGQMQKVATAGMLILNSKIIICDEATSMLDAKSRYSFIKFLKVLVKHHNYTVISLTHDMEEVYSSDCVTVLEKGEILIQTNPVQLFSDNYEKIKDFAPLPSLYVLKEQLGIEENLVSEQDLRELLCQLK